MKFISLIISAAVTAMGAMSAQAAEVIAHRGFWKADGAVQNSRAALKAAVDRNLYGSEIDIWITTDGHLMVNHDPSYGGVTIMDSTYDQCKEITLGNGEKMPQLQDMLDIVKASDNRTKLIIEVKGHGKESLDKAAATAAVNAVRAAGLREKVEYISFSDAACRQIIADDPEAKVAYLSGGVSPGTLRSSGYTGIDYHMTEIRNNPQWVKEAHDLGMTVNVWTVNSETDITEMMNRGVDYITTDDPLTALDIKTHYDSGLSE